MKEHSQRDPKEKGREGGESNTLVFKRYRVGFISVN